MNNVLRAFARTTLEKSLWKLGTDLKQITKPAKQIQPQHMTMIIPSQWQSTCLNDQHELLLVTCLITTFKHDLLFLMRMQLSLFSCLLAKGQEDTFMFRLLQPREAGAALKHAKIASLEIASERSVGLGSSVLGVIPEGFLAVIEFHRKELLKSTIFPLF